jgi:hypothetical protein
MSESVRVVLPSHADSDEPITCLGARDENFQETLESATLHPSPSRSVSDGVQPDAWVRRHVVYTAHGIVVVQTSSAETCTHLHTGRLPENLRHHV